MIVNNPQNVMVRPISSVIFRPHSLSASQSSTHEQQTTGQSTSTCEQQTPSQLNSTRGQQTTGQSSSTCGQQTSGQSSPTREQQTSGQSSSTREQQTTGQSNEQNQHTLNCDFESTVDPDSWPQRNAEASCENEEPPIDFSSVPTNEYHIPEVDLSYYDQRLVINIIIKQFNFLVINI